MFTIVIAESFFFLRLGTQELFILIGIPLLIFLPIIFFTKNTKIRNWLMRKSEARYFRWEKSEKESNK